MEGLWDGKNGRDGGPGKFKVSSSSSISSRSASKVPVNLLNRHTKRVMEQQDDVEEGWEFDKRQGTLPAGSLLLQSPTGNGFGHNMASLSPHDAVAEHYKSLLFSEPSHKEGYRPSLQRRETPGFQQTSPTVIHSPKEFHSVRSEKPANLATWTNPLLSKYKVSFVPKGMKRPAQPYAQPNLFDPIVAGTFFETNDNNPSSNSLYGMSPEPAHPKDPPQQPSIQSSQPFDQPHVSPYFQFPVHASNGAFEDEDSLPPSLYEKEQAELDKKDEQEESASSRSEGKESYAEGSQDEKAYPSVSRRHSISTRVQGTPTANEGRGEVSEEEKEELDGDQYTEQDDGDYDDYDEHQESDQEQPEEGEQDEGGSNEDEEDLDTEENLAEEETDLDDRAANDSSQASKYVQIITQLTDELSKAQDRIQELEEQRESERQELERELEDLDKGNLDLKGRTVALQRQVVHMTSERQDYLIKVQELRGQNKTLQRDFDKISEIANMLQTKVKFLEAKLVKMEKTSHRSGGPIRDPPRNMEEALDKIRDLQDVNFALRENIRLRTESKS